MYKKQFMLMAVLVALLATVGTASAANNRNFRAHLSGDEAGADTLAQGQAIFQFSKDGDELSYKLIVANIENIRMAHIHLAEEAGGSGPPVVWLYPDAPPPVPIPGRFDGVLATGTVTADDLVGPLAGMSLDDLKTAMEQSLTYVNVHTDQYPDGEIRGEIR